MLHGVQHAVPEACRAVAAGAVGYRLVLTGLSLVPMDTRKSLLPSGSRQHPPDAHVTVSCQLPPLP